MMFRHTTVHMLLVYQLTAAQRQRCCELITQALLQNALAHAIGSKIPLRQTARAHLEVESGRVTGNVVVEMP
jgi:NADPH2:quinone reductase